MTAPVPARRADDRRHVGPGADAASVTVVLRPSAAWTGRLATAAGEPRAEVRVTAEFADASHWELSAIDRCMAAPVWTHG